MMGVAEDTLDAVDKEVRSLSEESYRRAVQLLTDNRARLDSIVSELLKNETLDEDAVYAAAGIAHTKQA